MCNLFKRVERFKAWAEPTGCCLGIGLLTTLWVGLLLAELGRFTAWLPLLTGIAAAGFAWRHSRRRQAGCVAPKAGRLGLLATGALALATLTFTIPPSEFLLGGWDPGVYVHTASVVAREGELLPEAPDLAALSACSRMRIGRQGQNAWEPFLGMRMLPDGRISPQFYHLYPVAMALLWPFGGVRAALLLNPLLNVACILFMYLWARRWVRPHWAFAAALLLALNPAQVWQAGFATSELLAQCLLLGGLVATGRALSGKTNEQMYALMGGLSLGLMMLTKYEAILFVVPFSIFLLASLRNRSQRRTLLILLGTIAVLGVHVGLHQIFFSPLYYPMGNWVLPGLAVAGVVALLVTTLALLNPQRTVAKLASKVGKTKWLPVATIVGFAAWVFFAWYVRPHLTVDGRVTALFTRLIPGLKDSAFFAFLAGRNARNFWYLQSLFGTAGLIAALTGVGIMMARKRTVWQTAWLAASIAALIALITQISHEPYMMFVARRMVPVILPLLCLGVAALCDQCEWLLRKYPCRALLAGILIILLPLAGTFRDTVFQATHREWPGLANWLDKLADEIPPDAAVYSDAPGFAAPLRFMYGIPAYEVRALAPGERNDPMAMMLNAAEHRPVFWLSWAPIPDAYAAYAEPTEDLRLRSSILGTTKHTLPRYIRPRGATFTLFRIIPRSRKSGDRRPEGVG